MSLPSTLPLSLITGERMTREEFLRRWEDLPGLKHAELIEGVVHVPSPVSADHGHFDDLMSGWLAHYRWVTPGCQGGHNTTWLMSGSAPQPDVFLSTSSRIEGKFHAGAPELAIEICVTSTEVDFGPKLALYQLAGVQEYITVETLGKRIIWRELKDGSYKPIQSGFDGVLRSRAFPGLWLNVAAFWADDKSALLATLKSGMETPEYREFAARLQSKTAP